MYIPGTPSVDSAKVFVAKSKGDKEVHLKNQMHLSHSEVKVADNCSALIDTGAEVCLIRKGMVTPDLFEPARRRLHFVGANGQRLEGGFKEVLLELNISGTLQETGRQVDLKIPTYFYEADIKDDAILSYNQCRLRGVDLSARHHGLLCVNSGQEIWIDGLRAQVTPWVL